MLRCLSDADSGEASTRGSRSPKAATVFGWLCGVLKALSLHRSGYAEQNERCDSWVYSVGCVGNGVQRVVFYWSRRRRDGA